MAMFHLHHGFVSRSTGRSSVQSAAYICGEKLHEDRRDKNADYSNRNKDVALVKTLAPEHSKYKDLSVWNEIENFEDSYAEKYFKTDETREKYKSCAQTAQTIVLALPNEFSIEISEELLDNFIFERFISRGLIVTYAIHNAEENLHAHLQISRRAIGEDGEFVGRKDREICTKSALLETRELFANLTNEFLEREGFSERVTAKSFEDLGINLEATKHRGYYADQLGTDSRIAQENIEIRKENEERLLSDPSIIINLLNEKKAVFTQKDVLKEIADRVFDEKNISVIFEMVVEESIHVGENVNGEFLYTGEKYQQLESDVLSKFDILSSQMAKATCSDETVSSILSKYGYLSEEQKSAVIGLTKYNNFGILLGKAGAGKTTTMKAISEIYGQSGSRVIGMSLSAVASENLGKDAEIESATIASWSHRWRTYETAKEKFLSFNSVVTDGVLKQLDWYNDLQRYEQYQLKSGDTIIVDEAGMVGTKEWKVILDAAERFNAKIIAVGDDNQFKPISAGNCFRYFVNQNENVLELSKIRRQKEPWMREASVELSKLNVGTALERYEHYEKIHAIDNAEISKRIAERYLEIDKITGVGDAHVRFETSAVLCSTNAECAIINNEIRSLKKERGEIGKTVCSIQATSDNRQSCRDFSENDKIMFLENNKGLDVKNGQYGSVKSFNDGILSIQTESGIKNIDIEEYSKIDHAYAITLNKSQGKTYDNTILLASKLMDAKAAYVGLTRHRDNVDIYYSKSVFGSFKDLVNSASKYSHKDSLVDYEHSENLNKIRVFEYQSLRLEMASVLKDIHCGEATWKDYNTLKAIRLEAEKKILNNYESHKLYLDQLGITKEKIEISLGLKQRPMTKLELYAKSTVALYAKASQETRVMYDFMRKECYNIKDHKDYGEYCSIRGIRNGLAKEILSNRPLYREFVNEMSRECFVSFKAMESQVNYAEKINVGEKSEITHADVGKEAKFFQNISEIKTPDADGRFIVNTSDFIKSEQNSSIYKLSLEAHRENEGYGLYVSNSMLDTYISSKGIEIEPKEYINEYASMLVQKIVDEQKIKKISPELLESCIKQALCFETLKQAADQKELTPDVVNILHSKAQALSEKLSDDNIRILNDKELMKQASEVLTSKEIQSLPENYTNQIIDSNAQELVPERNSLDINERSLENLREIADTEPSYTREEPEISRDRGMCR